MSQISIQLPAPAVGFLKNNGSGALSWEEAGGGGAWGEITGTLSAQTDLQAALDDKVAGPASSTDNGLVRWDGTGGTAVQDTSTVTITDAGVFTVAPTGSPTALFAINGTAATAYTNGFSFTGTLKNAAANLYHASITGGTASGPLVAMFRGDTTGGSYTNGTICGIASYNDMTNTGRQFGGADGAALGNFGGYFIVSPGGNTASLACGSLNMGYFSNWAVGAYNAGLKPQGTSPRSYGSINLASKENSAQCVAVYGRVQAASDADFEKSNAGQSAVALFDNNNTTVDILTLLDGGVEKFVVEDGGTIDISGISAGVPNLRITATSDTPTVTWGASAGNESSTAPAGYLEISVGGNPRYIPFWA